jgi:flagellar assembly factor FliW
MVEATTIEQTITVELPRLGTCTYRESEVLTFPWGLPGFPACRRFLALAVETHENVLYLQSLDDLKVALAVADPWHFFPDYDPRLPAFARVSLELTRPEDFSMLGVLVIPETGTPTMNLLAPIIINLKTRIGRQVTIERGDPTQGEYQVRVPIILGDPSASEPAEATPE